MVISQTQCFLIAVVVAALYGATRGWGREIITCTVILGTVLFLSFGGVSFLTNLLAGTHTTGAAYQQAQTNAQTLGNLLFGGLTLLGYNVGHRYGGSPKNGNHRIMGLIPGLINGSAITYYVSHNILPGTQFLVNSPDGAQTTSYLPLIFVVGFIALIAVLFVAGQGSKSK